MAGETLGGELGPQVQEVLQVVRGLSTRMDTLSQQVQQSVQSLNTRMDKVEGWMERLGAEFIKSREELKDDIRNVRRELQDVRTELKADIQQVRTDLSSEMHGGFSQLRAEMHEGFHLVHGRIDRTNDAMNLMGSALNKVTTERVQNLEQRVRVLETRDPQA